MYDNVIVLYRVSFSNEVVYRNVFPVPEHNGKLFLESHWCGTSNLHISVVRLLLELFDGVVFSVLLQVFP